MYNEDRSDFAAPIVGFLYIGFAAAMIGIYGITAIIESLKGNLDSNIFYYVGVAGLVIAGFNLYKAYIPEGVTIGLVAFVAFAMQNMFSWQYVGIDDYAFYVTGAFLAAAIAFVILFAFTGVFSFLRGYLDLTIINGAMGFAAFFLVGWTGPKAVFVIGAIGAIAAAGIALYVAFCDWSFAQDVIEEIEDDFCCDDDECCCEEHGEDCDCEECKPAESVEAEVVEETEPAAEETKE
jgi:hypothetical protein